MTVDVVAEPDIDSHFFKIYDRFFLNGAFTACDRHNDFKELVRMATDCAAECRLWQCSLSIPKTVVITAQNPAERPAH